MGMDAYTAIEFPAAGDTYGPGIDGMGEEYGVYRYSEYPDWSVNAGRAKRSFLGSFATLEEAQRQYPDAEVSDGCGHVAVTTPDVAPDWLDPANAGESWDGD